MAIRIWSEETGTFVEPEDILACGADGVYYSVPRIDAPAADGAWGQVWPEKLYLIRDGVIDPAISSINTSVYFNAANNGLYLNQNTASFSSGGNYATLSGKGVANTESRSYLVSNGTIHKTGRKKLIVECSFLGSAYISASIGVITDKNCINLLKNTKRLYADEKVEYGFSWNYIAFERNGSADTNLKSYELDISELASEKLHLCMKVSTSGTTAYWITVNIKNIYLT